MAATQAQLDAILSAATTGGVASTGTITFSNAPSNNDTVTVNGVVFTAKTSPSGAVEFALGSDGATAATNLLAKLVASTSTAVRLANYTRAAGVITVTYGVVGTDGDAFTLAKSGSNIAVSGSVLSGGTDGTGNFDPGVIVDATNMDAPFERSVVALVAAVSGVLELSVSPASDAEKARRQRKVLKDMLMKVAADIPTVASTTDDRSAISAFVSSKALKKLEGLNTPETL